MNKKQIKKQIPDEALKLLPWYATGWVSPQERKYIQDILSQHSDFHELLNSEQKMISAIKEDKSILDQSCLETTQVRLNKVLKQLPKEKNKKILKKLKKLNQGILASLSHWFLSFSPKIQYAAFASITTLTIALSFVVIAPMLDEENVYYPATSTTKKNNVNSTTLLVGLNTEPADPRLLRILKENNAKINVVAGKSGMHQLNLSVKLNAKQTKSLLKELTDNTELFWFAGEEF